MAPRPAKAHKPAPDARIDLIRVTLEARVFIGDQATVLIQEDQERQGFAARCALKLMDQSQDGDADHDRERE